MKKQIKTLGVLALASLSALALAGCNDKPAPTPQPGPDQGTNVPEPDKPRPQVELGKPLPKPQEGETPTNASGVKSYVAASFEERQQILGVLEKYAVENNLTGITLYEDGGYVKYDEGVKLATPTYIEGYGYGAMTEGEITKPIKNPASPAWANYYHTFESENVATINQMNDKGSVVADLVGFVQSSYFDQRMNDYNDGYEWFGVTSKNKRPEALNANAQGLATKYRIEVKTGKDGFKYNTLSNKYSKYKGREVTIEDYVTPYKMYYTQAYGMARGAENLTGAGSLKGSSAYYQASAAGYNEAKFNEVGVKGYTGDDGKDYLEFEFNLPCSSFYAMYYTAGAMFSPVPADFIKDLGNGDFAEGMKIYGNKTTSLTQVDTFLSTGPYCIEKWDDQEIVFKKNELYKLQGERRFKMEGIHYAILKATKDDPEAAWREFEAGKLSSTGIPSTKLKEHKNDKTAKQTRTGTTTKMNLNTLDQATWDKFFGPEGSVTQTAPDKVRKVEPAMSNKKFALALNSAINREELANKRGAVPSCDFFGSNYQSNPEEGIVYGKTVEHKEAIASLTNGADKYGYSFDKAKKLFKEASDELIDEGKYKAGDTITLDVVWQSKGILDVVGKDVLSYWQKAFDECGSPLKLQFDNNAVTNWQDAYFKHMMVGNFDIALGGISGNPLNPLNFLDTTFSTQETGFTLCWSVDTKTVSPEIYYDGAYWSYEGLWTAAEKGGLFENGNVIKPYAVSFKEKVANADGSVDLVYNLDIKSGIQDLACALSNTVVCSDVTIPGKEETDYQEDVVNFTIEGNLVKVHLTKELVAKYNAANVVNPRVDFVFDLTISGIDSNEILTLALAK